MIDGSFCALPHSPSANEGPSRGGNDENDRECMGRDRLPFLLLLHDLLPWIIIYVVHVVLLVEFFKELDTWCDLCSHTSKIWETVTTSGEVLSWDLLTDTGEPKSYKEASASADSATLHLAMELETNSIRANKTSDLIELLKNRHFLPCKWVYRLKETSD